MSKPRIVAALVALSFALANPAWRVKAGEWRWAKFSHMGGSAAGVVTGEGAQLTFNCYGDTAPSPFRGPHLMGLLPSAKRADPSSLLEILIDSRAVQIPVELVDYDGAVAFVWRPDPKFDLSRMKSVITDLRGARQIQLRVADISAGLPIEGAAEALLDDPLQCQ